MSVQALSWVLDNSKAEHAARLVLISIANHCDKYGRCAWPSVNSIGREARLSERVVRSSMRQLEQLGELSVQFGQGPRGANTYSLPKMWGADSAPAESAPAEFVDGGQNSSETGAKFVGAIRKNRPEPSLEPSTVKEELLYRLKVMIRQQRARKEEVGLNAEAIAKAWSKELGVNINIGFVEKGIDLAIEATA